MTTSIRVRKNLLGESEPVTHKKELCDLLKDSYYDKIVMRPVYQRHIRWSPSAMNDFISTIMDNGLVPGIIMYHFAEDERASTEGKSYEMVDGQHRCFTLKAFMDSVYVILPHIKTEFIVHGLYKKLDDGTTEYSRVFYKETQQVIQYCQNNKWTPSYLTEDEREHFDHYGINVTLIRNKLTLDKRRENFMSLQMGIPGRGSDVLKTTTEMDSPEFNPRDETEISYIHDFDDVFRDFISFLQKIDGGYCLNPTQIFALFYVLCDETKNRDVILTHIPHLSREGHSRTKRTLWGSKYEHGPRRIYFNQCLNQIMEITEPALPLDDRQITKSLRKQVWNKCKDNLCEICEDKITEKEFEAGHIIPRALGGQTDLENLIPICFDCNRCMGTRNAYEYKRDVYPHTIDVDERM